MKTMRLSKGWGYTLLKPKGNRVDEVKENPSWLVWGASWGKRQIRSWRQMNWKRGEDQGTQVHKGGQSQFSIGLSGREVANESFRHRDFPDWDLKDWQLSAELFAVWSLGWGWQRRECRRRPLGLRNQKVGLYITLSILCYLIIFITIVGVGVTRDITLMTNLRLP